MRPINPTRASNTPTNTLRVAQSMYKTMSGNVQESQPTGQDSTGVYNTFEQDNGAGITIRIGAASSSEPVKWVTSNVGVAVNHGLQRQPTGFRVWDKDKTCDVYRTVPPNANTITLACTDATANVTVYIF